VGSRLIISIQHGESVANASRQKSTKEILTLRFSHWHHCASQHRLNDFTPLIGRHVAQADDPVAGPGTRRPQIDNFGFYGQHVARSHQTRPAQKEVIDPFNARLRGAEGVNQRRAEQPDRHKDT
jgi:hypothetical protein